MGCSRVNLYHCSRIKNVVTGKSGVRDRDSNFDPLRTGHVVLRMHNANFATLDIISIIYLALNQSGLFFSTRFLRRMSADIL